MARRSGLCHRVRDAARTSSLAGRSSTQTRRESKSRFLRVGSCCACARLTGRGIRGSMLGVPHFAHARVAAASGAVELVSNRIFLVVVLVVFLGRIEGAGRYDLGVDMRPATAFFHLGLARFCRRPLGVVRVEDRAAVLITVIAELLILNRGIN